MNMTLPFVETRLNLLPYDGSAVYYGPVLSSSEAEHFFSRLLETAAWKNDEAVIFGRHIVTRRKVAWYGDEAYSYLYSNKKRVALPWIRELLELKDLVEDAAQSRYNSCLLNLYHDGNDGMGWHGDDETTLAKNGSIASLSLGAERRFFFKHRKTKQQISLLLEPGSLLEMKGETQRFWWHSLPKSKKVSEPRINLTFRTMVVPNAHPGA
jgi:alkylated DNA repair dioxygenase AlkB